MPLIDLPKLLLVEDDPSIQRFVSLALDDIMSIHCASTVQQALQCLQAAAFNVIITDLMMPGETGMDLLKYLREHPAWQGTAKVMMFSAGITPSVEAELKAFDVWKVLPKPIALQELIQAVTSAMTSPVSTKPNEVESPPATGDQQLLAVQQFFNGNQALFLAYQANCLKQFASDIASGNRFLSQNDWLGLQRLAHSLKSVLLMLGRPEAHQLARQIEHLAQAHETAKASTAWHQLAADLQAWISQEQSKR